jgi:tRNA pseudouridine38-40 synthase
VRKIRLVVEYDGTMLSGWQRQANAPTVQQHLEEALAQLLQHEVTIAGASRTDAGVHALGQVAAFETERSIPLHGIRRGLNSMLPDTIAVRSAEEVPLEFHPRFGATGKHYRYTIHRAADRSPLLRERAWHHAETLDVARMRDAARALVGEHDFAAFRAAGCTARTTVRRVDSVELTEAPDLLYIDVKGNAFLRNMVRIVVGTLADVGRSALEVGQVAEILASRDRTKAGKTAPAHGLTLVEVRYDGIRVSSDNSTR